MLNERVCKLSADPLCRIVPVIIAISGWSDSWRFLSRYYPIMKVNRQVRNSSGVGLTPTGLDGVFFPPNEMGPRKDKT